MSVVLTDEVKHLTSGLAGYRRGCRCPECVEGNKAHKRSYHERNKAARNAKRREYYESNKPAKKAYDAAYRARTYDPAVERDRSLRKKYGITSEQYDEMFKTQGGVCAICPNGPGKMGVLAVDHDHACCPGKKTCGQCIRGLLCWPCNSFLGRIQDQPDRLIGYLSRAEERRSMR